MAVIIQYPQYWGTKSREQRFSRLFGVSCPAGEFAAYYLREGKMKREYLESKMSTKHV